MVILDITILAPGSQVGKKIGNPQTLTDESLTSKAAAPPMQPAPKPAPTPQRAMPMAPTNMDSSMLSTQMTHPIASLSPYQNK